MQPPGTGQGQIAFQAILYLVLVAACLLAWYNFRARRVDQRGALRMATWLFVCLAASAFLEMHHSATTQESSGFWHVVAQALINMEGAIFFGAVAFVLLRFGLLAAIVSDFG